MSISAWSSRLSAIGASANEVSAITASYYAASSSVQSALDSLVEGIANSDLLIMLNTWRSSGGPFEDGFPGGGLPFGTGAAVLTGNPADDVYPISAGTGRKMTALSTDTVGVLISAEGPLTQSSAAVLLAPYNTATLLETDSNGNVVAEWVQLP